MLQELAGDQEQEIALYFTEDWLAEGANAAFLESTNIGGQTVSSEVMAVMSATKTPPGVLAVVSVKPLPLPGQPAMVLILDALTTPGNLGTMLRTAGAAGVDAVLLGPGCVDAYNPKVVRGGMGAHFRVPLREMSWKEIMDYCQGLDIWLSAIGGQRIYTAVDWRRPSALIIGNEAHGAGQEARAAAQAAIAIPMANETESLNAATAAAVILFEAFRQRGFLDEVS